MSNSTLQALIANTTKQCKNHMKHNVSSESLHSEHQMDHHSGHHMGSAGAHDVKEFVIFTFKDYFFLF